MSNFLVDIGLNKEQESVGVSSVPSATNYLSTLQNVTQPTVNAPQRVEQEIDLASFGLQNMQEYDLMTKVKEDGGSPEDFREILTQTRISEDQKFNESFKQEEEISGLDIGVKFGRGAREIAENFKLQSNIDDNLAESAGKFLANLPANTVQLGGDIVTLVADPVGTGKSLLDLGQGITDKLVFSSLNKIFGKDTPPTEKALMVDAIGGELKKIATTPGRVKELLVENPADVLLAVTGGLAVAKSTAKAKGLTGLVNKLEKAQDITNPINILKKEAQLVKSVVTTPLKAGKAVTASVLGKTTGAGSEAIKQAFRSGGKKTFADALRGDITDNDILIAARRGLETVKENRRKLYGDENYNKLISNKTQLDIDPMRQDLLTKLDDFKVTVDDKGALDFSKSTITQGNSQKQIQGIFDDVMSWNDKTPEGMDILKQRVADRWIGGEGTAKGDVFSTALGNKIKDRIVKEVPEYKTMVDSYSQFTDEIRDIEKVLRVGDDKNKMTAITRLNQVFKDNIAFRKEALELLESSAGIDLKSSLAGAALRDIMPKGLQGVIGGGAIGLGVTGGLFSPTVISGLIASSPRVIGEIARAVGMTTNQFKKGLQGLQKVQKAMGSKVDALKPVILEKITDKITK